LAADNTDNTDHHIAKKRFQVRVLRVVGGSWLSVARVVRGSCCPCNPWLVQTVGFDNAVTVM